VQRMVGAKRFARQNILPSRVFLTLYFDNSVALLDAGLCRKREEQVIGGCRERSDRVDARAKRISAGILDKITIQPNLFQIGRRKPDIALAGCQRIISIAW